jgi:hypothetical protein
MTLSSPGINWRSQKWRRFVRAIQFILQGEVRFARRRRAARVRFFHIPIRTLPRIARISRISSGTSATALRLGCSVPALKSVSLTPRFSEVYEQIFSPNRFGGLFANENR